MSYVLNFYPQVSATEMGDGVFFMKLYVLVIVVGLSTMLLVISASLIWGSYFTSSTPLGHTAELAWTILPSFVLLFMGYNSLNLLYVFDMSSGCVLTIKSTGYQWYWGYEYSDFNEFSFESYMITDCGGDEYRLLEVDNRVVMPSKAKIRILTTSADVIHNWALPSMSIKLDAIPGRLNQAFIEPDFAGVFYGQCSEICGANHTFMPIGVEVVSAEDFFQWVDQWDS